MSTIANTTVISNFAAIGQLDLVHRLFERLSISTEVYEEIQAGLEQANLWLQQMIEKGYYSPVSDLSELLPGKP